MTARAEQLVEAGVRAFSRGERAEAEQRWREALAVDPFDARAREYLARLAGGERAPERPPVAKPPQAPPPPPSTATSAWDEVPAAGEAIALPPQGGVDFAALDPAAPEPEPLRPEVDEPPDAEEDTARWMKGARELFALGDFTGSLELVEKVLDADPRHAEALAYLAENEATLVAMYESRLQPLSARPRVRLRPEEILWLNLDHRAGFLLSQVDGNVSWEDLFAVSGLPRLEAARILARLVGDGVVAA